MRALLSFFIAGIPKAQPRAKARRFGNFARVYDQPGKHDDWKIIVRTETRAAWEKTGDLSPWVGPLCVNLTFYFPRPKSHYRSNGELKPNRPKWHTSKPDRDNSDKAILDALSNLGIWPDDQQVCDGRIQKLYADITPGCAVEIKEAGE